MSARVTNALEVLDHGVNLFRVTPSKQGEKWHMVGDADFDHSRCGFVSLSPRRLNGGRSGAVNETLPSFSLERADVCRRCTAYWGVDDEILDLMVAGANFLFGFRETDPFSAVLASEVQV